MTRELCWAYLLDGTSRHSTNFSPFASFHFVAFLAKPVAEARPPTRKSYWTFLGISSTDYHRPSLPFRIVQRGRPLWASVNKKFHHSFFFLRQRVRGYGCMTSPLKAVDNWRVILSLFATSIFHLTNISSASSDLPALKYKKLYVTVRAALLNWIDMQSRDRHL